MGMFWEIMPSWTYLSKEEACAPGFKAAEDRITVLLGGNENDGYRHKLLVLHHLGDHVQPNLQESLTSRIFSKLTEAADRENKSN